MKKHLLGGLFIFGTVVGGTIWIWGPKSPSGRPAVSAPREHAVQMVEPEYEVDSHDELSDSRSPASETVRGGGEDEINTLTDDGITRDDLSGNPAFTNKYGEFFVEVIADKHDEDAPSLMKFYVKCKDNRPVKSGLPPARVLIGEGNVNNQTTCHYNDVTFKENPELGDTVTVEYNIDVTRGPKKTKASKGRQFCDQVMKMDFNFPELCEKWNPDAFE